MALQASTLWHIFLDEATEGPRLPDANMRQRGSRLVDRPQREHPCFLAIKHLTQGIVRIRSRLELPYVGRVGGRFRVGELAY